MPSVQVSSVFHHSDDRYILYQAALPTTHVATDGVTMPEGVGFTIPYVGVGNGLSFNVSAPVTAAGITPHISVYGAFEGPSVNPTDMNWGIVRGDTLTGVNVVLQGVNCNQYVRVGSPAAVYRIRVSSAAGDRVTDTITWRVFVYPGG